MIEAEVVAEVLGVVLYRVLRCGAGRCEKGLGYFETVKLGVWSLLLSVCFAASCGA